MSDSIDVHGLPAKLRAEAEDCDAKAREREAESPRNGQWFRGCANGHRLAADELESALRQSGEADQFVRNQPCGCVMCVCADESRCHGCGAKHCGNRTDHQPYVKTAPPATSGLVEALRMAIRQNEHDMMMTSEELLQCYAALAAHDASKQP